MSAPADQTTDPRSRGNFPFPRGGAVRLLRDRATHMQRSAGRLVDQDLVWLLRLLLSRAAPRASANTAAACK
jgi:hypothetical protein